MESWYAAGMVSLSFHASKGAANTVRMTITATFLETASRSSRAIRLDDIGSPFSPPLSSFPPFFPPCPVVFPAPGEFVWRTSDRVRKVRANWIAAARSFPAREPYLAARAARSVAPMPMKLPSGSHPSDSHATSATIASVPARSIQKKKDHAYPSLHKVLATNSAAMTSRHAHMTTPIGKSAESGAETNAATSVRKSAVSIARKRTRCACAASMMATTSRRTRSWTHHHLGNAADPRRDRLGDCEMDLPPLFDAPSDRCEGSLGLGADALSAGYLPGVRLLPADCSVRIEGLMPTCFGGVRGSPVTGVGSTLTVTSVSRSSSSRSSRRIARECETRASRRRAVRGTWRGRDARYVSYDRARRASRVLAGGAGAQPKASDRITGRLNVALSEKTFIWLSTKTKTATGTLARSRAPPSGPRGTSPRSTPPPSPRPVVASTPATARGSTETAPPGCSL